MNDTTDADGPVLKADDEVARPLTRHRLILRAVVGASIVILIGVALQSRRPVWFGRPYLHREVHWLTFGWTTLLVCLAARNVAREALWATSVAFLGASIEYLQHQIYRTKFDWTDVCDDIGGVLTVFLLRRAIPRVRHWRA